MEEINATLLDDLLTHYDEPGLRQFCQQVGVLGYDDLAGDDPRSKMVHLIGFAERRGWRQRLAQLLTGSHPHLAPKYRSLLYETERFEAQAAAIDDALGWLEELAAGEGSALDEAPTTTWPSDESAVPRVRRDSGLSWIDRLAQGSGAAVEEGPTMTWSDEEHPAVALEPYQVGGHITSPDYFFGREAERHALRTRLLDMGSSVIVGLPYSGKSSLLYALAHFEPLPAAEHFLLAYVDMTSGRFSPSANRSQTALLNTVWQQWVAQIKPRRGQSVPPATSPVKQLSDFGRWVRILREKGYRPVLCLDGLTAVPGQNGLVDEPLLALWHKLGNEGLMAFLLTAERPLGSLLPPDWLRSGFDTIFYQQGIGLLSEEAARSLLVEPARRRDVAMPSPLVERWLDYAGRYPIFLQMAGSLLWETLTEDGQVGAAAEAALQYKFRQWGGPQWQRIWQALSPEARQDFPRRATVPTTPAARVVCRHLVGRGLLVVDGARYRPYSSAFAQWLVQTHPQPAEPTATAQPEPEKPNGGWLRRLVRGHE